MNIDSFAFIQDWTNDNPGFLALLCFLIGLMISFTIWIVRKITNKKKTNLVVTVDKHDQATLCTSFNTGTIKNNKHLHRTVFIIYLKIKNTGNEVIVIDKVRLGYKSKSLSNPEQWFWINDETILLEDYAVPLSNGKTKLYPFLKQISPHDRYTPNLRLNPKDTRNGVVYFEQQESSGLDLPYMDMDYRVNTIIVVTDTDGKEWSVEHRVLKVKIEAIREHNPLFGLTRQGY